ncbi:hypothetical protein [Micromonospora yangpuensis]|uniref:Uncharacterized protein n=1 Tax=Micromonospora yangpuensis TaxID=683228 RepID=A0A1C6U270_9ACTN|nr:hypothetical protein [Micromonospora yangpuensis]GGM10388.1 hypothetical protein GCM10012279_30550 [Micromonospora yangpuensis]SCL48142.1 hypothetical protein GA0070617_0788 [Micromonospora yangpuensis]
MEDMAVEATEFADLDIVDLDLPIDEELAAVSIGGLGNTEVGASGFWGRSWLI